MMSDLFASSKPKPKRKRKSRAKQRPASESCDTTSETGVPRIPKPLHGPAGNVDRKVPGLDSGEQTTPNDRRGSAKGTKHRISPVAPAPSKTVQKTQEKKKPKRRCRKRDPTEQPSQPWTEAEIAQFRKLVKEEGATAWKDKSAKLQRLCGNLRTPKALHTRYLREIGRIVDRPRGQDQLSKQQSASSDSKKPGAAATQSNYTAKAKGQRLVVCPPHLHFGTLSYDTQLTT